MGSIITNMGSLYDTLIGWLILLGVLAFLALAIIRVGFAFVVRRLASLIFILLGVSMITFAFGRAVPGDVVLVQINAHYKPWTVAHMRHLYGLDLPWYLQYLHYLGGLLHFDFGSSWLDYNLSVTTIFARYLPASLELGFWGTLLTIMIGVPMGLYTASHANTSRDSGVQFIAMLLYVLPAFIIIPFYDIAMVGLSNLGLPTLAISGWGTWDSEIAPVVIYAAGAFAYYVRLTRSTMIEEMRKDYVLAARAKGLTDREVLWRHAFRNTLIPLLTSLGPTVASLVGGLFIIEKFFSIPGIASEELTAINSLDIPVIEGATILLAAAIVFMNLVADVCYGLVDPRVRTG